jgi:hypothetical protein
VIGFHFEKRYDSIESLRADMNKIGSISVWKHYDEVIADRVDDDELVVFNVFEDGHLEFDHIEEFAFI